MNSNDGHKQQMKEAECDDKLRNEYNKETVWINKNKEMDLIECKWKKEWNEESMNK